jgi:ATP-binding cassette, subfamily C, bacterial LapB
MDINNNDPLLDCLLILARQYHRQYSPQSLVAGLPLVNGRLTPEIFSRAATRAGFSSQIDKRKISEIPKQVFPCILFLDEMGACILLEINDEGLAKIIRPSIESDEINIEIDELENHYFGYCAFIKNILNSKKESVEPVHTNKHWFWGTIKKSWGLYAEVIVASLLINIFALVTPLFVMNVYDRVVPNNAIETLWVLAIGVSIVMTFDLVMKILRGYFIDTAGKRADVILSSKIFEHVLGIQLSKKPDAVGSFANNLHEFETFRDFFTSSTLIALIDLPFVFLFLFVIWAIGGTLALIPLFAVPLVVIIGIIIQIPLKKLIHATFLSSSKKHATLIESLSGIESVKILGAEGFLQQHWEQEVGNIAKLGQKSRLLSQSAINISAFIQQITYVAVVVYGVYIIVDGNLTMGGLIACTILTGRSLAPMSQVAGIMTRYHQSIAAYQSLNNIMKMDIERPDTKMFLPLSSINGGVEFKNVCFAYPNQSGTALNNISFKINPGEKVGIIGRVGSGKTTINKLILGLYQPDEGNILIDGTDIRQVDPIQIRNQIGCVPQDIVLFRGSIKDNITFGAPPVDESVIRKAAEISGIDEYINLHPNGYDIVIGERGAGLSGGQKQSIAIARAILLNPSILLMDEPTNSLDNTTEEQFKQQLTECLPGKTLLLVTHKTTPLSLVDRLIVIDSGQIVVDGPKEKVIQALANNRVNAS